MQNEQIWVAEFQPGITLRLCQGAQNLEFLRTTTTTKRRRLKTKTYAAQLEMEKSERELSPQLGEHFGDSFDSTNPKNFVLFSELIISQADIHWVNEDTFTLSSTQLKFNECLFSYYLCHPENYLSFL